jgi:hypothetical protein
VPSTTASLRHSACPCTPTTLAQAPPKHTCPAQAHPYLPKHHRNTPQAQHLPAMVPGQACMSGQMSCLGKRACWEPVAPSFIIVSTVTTSMPPKLQQSHASSSRGSPLLPYGLPSLCCSLLLRIIPSTCSLAPQASSGDNRLL